MKRRRFLAGVAFLLLCLLTTAAAQQEGKGLSWLAVNHGIFSPVFSPLRNTYYAILDNGIDSFEAAGVEMRPLNPEAKVTAVCLDALDAQGALPQGRRVTYLITVEETTGEASRYYLKLYRKAAYTAPIQEGYELAQLTINGGKIDVPYFSGIKAYYEVGVAPGVTPLSIQAYPADRSKMATVINAPESMPDEPVCVSILVTSPGEEKMSVYTLVLKPEGFALSLRYTALELLSSVILAFVLGAGLAFAFVRRGHRA